MKDLEGKVLGRRSPLRSVGVAVLLVSVALGPDVSAARDSTGQRLFPVLRGGSGQCLGGWKVVGVACGGA